MKLILWFLLVLPSWALPDFEQAKQTLIEGSASERDALTQELWTAGDDALPLIAQLLDTDDPEIKRRAHFLQKRILLGLRPDSPKPLLALAEAAMNASSANKNKPLQSLLDEEDGFAIALRLLNRWCLDERFSPERLRELAGTVLFRDHLNSSRLEAPLNNRCRGLLVAILANEGLHEHRVAIKLTLADPLAIFHEARTHQPQFTRDTLLGIARGAILLEKPADAHAILKMGASTAKDASRDLALFPEENEESPEVSLFRFREAGQWQEASALEVSSELKEDTLLLSGQLKTLLDSAEHTPLLQAVLQELTGLTPANRDALHDDNPKTLAKALCALGHSSKAIDVLHDSGNHRRALGLLLAQDQQAEALTYLEKISESEGSDDLLEARLYLANALHSQGDREAAQQVFTPLLTDVPKRVGHRQRTVGLAYRVYDLETALKLSRHIRPGFSAHEMIGDMGALFPGQGMTMALWTAQIWKNEPNLSAPEAVEKATLFLKSPEAYEQAVAQLQGNSTLEKKVLQEMALRLHRPEMIPALEKKARHKDDGRLLLPAIRDTELPLPTRLRACEIALEISPTLPVLHAYHEIISNKPPTLSHTLALGGSSAWIQIGKALGQAKRTDEGYRAYEKALAYAADDSTFQLLKRLGLKSAREGKKENARRLLQAAIVKGITEEQPRCADLSPVIKAHALLRE